MRCIATQEKGFAVDVLIEAAGEFECGLRGRRAEGLQLAVGRRRRGQCIDDPALLVEPDHLRDVRVVFQQVIGA